MALVLADVGETRHPNDFNQLRFVSAPATSTRSESVERRYLLLGRHVAQAREVEVKMGRYERLLASPVA